MGHSIQQRLPLEAPEAEIPLPPEVAKELAEAMAPLLLAVLKAEEGRESQNDVHRS